MVGPLMILKMLHCKQLKPRKIGKLCQKRDVEDTSHYKNTTANKVKQNSDDYENVHNVCRVCLKDGTIPIFEDNRSEDYAEYINLFGGINVEVEDTLPKYLCESCLALLQGAILFRTTAQQSNNILKESQHEVEESKFEIKEDMPPDDNIDIDEDTAFNFRTEKDENINDFYCKRCELKFQSLEEYEEHRLSDEHENIKRQCPVCQKLYTAMYFKRHLRLHNVNSNYICDICGKQFAIQGHFSRHRLTHFYSLPYKCSECPYRGRFSESLKMHMRSHTGEKPYQCSQCPARFISKSNLNKHTLTHRGEYDFKCEACGRGFYKKRDLELHFKVDHTGIKDHICNVCGKAFGYRKQMMKHQLKVHKRQKLRSGRMPLYLQVEMKKQQA